MTEPATTEESTETKSADLQENWRSQIADEELRAHPALASFKELGAMAKGYVDLKSYQGNSLHIPGEDAGDEQRAEFVTKLIDKVPDVMLRPDLEDETKRTDFYRSAGMPKEQKEYEMPEVEVPEGVTAMSDERADFLRGVAHKNGLNKSQFKGMMEEVYKNDIEAAVNEIESHKEATEVLNKEWGAAADERKQAALSIGEKTGAPEGIMEAMKAGNLPPEMTKWMYELSKAIGTEGTNLINNEQQKVGKMTPDEAKEAIQDIYANKEHPFHKGDRRAQKRMLELVALSSPGSSTNVDDLRTGISFNP